VVWRILSAMDLIVKLRLWSTVAIFDPSKFIPKFVEPHYRQFESSHRCVWEVLFALLIAQHYDLLPVLIAMVKSIVLYWILLNAYILSLFFLLKEKKLSYHIICRLEINSFVLNAN
jgi:hypothetical protein